MEHIMIKRNWKLIAVCAFVQCFVSALFAVPLRGGVNVKDFGAKGDGITDDTAAFSAAAKAIWLNAKAESKSRRQRFRKEKTGSKEGPRQCLYVPKGRYVLSGTVVFGSDAFVVGEDGVELIGTDSAKDIFYVHGAYRVRFENLAFSGGRSHLKVETLNKDTANVLVTGCRFRKSAATAFYSPSFGIDGKGVGEWIYDAAQGAFVKNERYLSKELRGNNHSTMIVIDNCLFEHCGRAIEMDPDGSVLRNSRFIMAPGATNAAIFASNQIHAYGLDIAHYAGSAAFECDGKVAMWFEDSSVTTLDGSGARVLRGKVSNSTQAAHLIMADIRTDAGLAKGNAICSFQGAFPAIASLVRVKAEGPNEVKAFSFAPEEDVEAFDASRRIKVWEPDRFFSYGIRDCSANIVKPAGFAKRFLREVPKWAAAAGGARCRLERPEMKGAVRKWMDPKWHVNFRTCEINRDTVVECSGVAALVGLGPDAPWFVVKKGAKAVFRNLQVHGGQSFVVVEDGAEAYVDSCYVYDGESSAFVCHKGGRLVVDNGVYCTARLYEGDGDAFIRSVWHTFTDIVPQDMPLADESSIVNRGKLVLWDVLGVPQVFSRFTKKFPTWDPVTEYSVRWVDNHGDFMSRMVRYGSERGGVTPVWHHGNARTLIEGHYAGFWNRSIPHTPVMCDAPNSDVKIFGVAFSQSRHRLKHIEMLWRDGKGVKRTMPDAQMHFTCPTKDVSGVSEIRPGLFRLHGAEQAWMNGMVNGLVR